MEPKDPRALSDEDLESRLREEAHQRYNAELWVRRELDEWAVGFTLHTTPLAQTNPGSVLHQEIIAPDRRHALEQVWLLLDAEDDIADYRRGR
jgi:hypothetical protein